MSSPQRSQADHPSASPQQIRRRTLVVFLIALAALIVVGLDYRDDPFFETYVSDPASYDGWAKRIASDGLTDEPAFHQSPLFPLALALVYDGVPDSSARIAALLVQSLLLALAIALLFPIGVALFGNQRAALAAAAVALTYGPFAFYGLKLLPLAITLATQALALWLWLRLRANVTWGRSLLAGLAVGLACVARAEFLLFIPLALALLWPQRARVPALLLFVAAIAASIAPVTLHNVAHGDATLIASSAGENLFIGNQRGADGGHKALDPKAGDLFSQRILARKIAEDARGEELSGNAISTYWRGRAWAEITASPAEWLVLEGRKLLRMITPGDPTDLYSLRLERRSYIPSLYLLALPTLGLWVLAALGIWSLRSHGLARALPLLGLLGLHAATLMVFFASTRLRLPMLFWLCPLAGLGVSLALDRWSREDQGDRRWVLTLGVLLAVIAVADVRLQHPDDQEVLRVAAVLSMQGRLDESLQAMTEALDRDSPDAMLLDQAGWVRSKMNEFEAAESFYLRALEAGLPASREQQTRSRLAGVLERMNRLPQAAAEHQRSIDVNPAEAGAWFERAMFRLRHGDREGAIADLREAGRLMPDWRAPQDVLLRLDRGS